MDAAYAAYVEYLGWLRRPATLVDRVYWYALRSYAQGDERSEDYLVPWYLAHVSRLHHLKVTMEYRVYDPFHHLSAARSLYGKPYVARQVRIIKHTDYGQYVSNITLAPAIYLSMIGGPMFVTQPPLLGAVLKAAIQLT